MEAINIVDANGTPYKVGDRVQYRGEVVVVNRLKEPSYTGFFGVRTSRDAGDDTHWIVHRQFSIIPEENQQGDYDYVNPAHYKDTGFSLETIDMMLRIWGPEKVSTHCEITAFKYQMRMGRKPGESGDRDRSKRDWYLAKAKELGTSCRPTEFEDCSLKLGKLTGHMDR